MRCLVIELVEVLEYYCMQYCIEYCIQYHPERLGIQYHVSKGEMNTVYDSRGEIIKAVRSVGQPAARYFAVIGEKGVHSMYVCMYVWSSHVAEYGSTG